MPCPPVAWRTTMLSMSQRPVNIVTVPARRRDAALSFLLAGDAPQAWSRKRAARLKELLVPRSKPATMLFQAKRGQRCVAAAMIISTPGRVGILLHSPALADGVDPSALSQLIAAISQKALADGMAHVQTSLAPSASADISAVASGGLWLLAELVYMRRDLAEPVRGGAAPHDLTWRSYGQFDEDQLARVIAATYEGTLDCPVIAGLRGSADVIAGHKTSGIFTPASWWIADWSSKPAGCILVNDSPGASGAEVVYLGVAPEFRRRSLARTMLLRCAAQAKKNGKVILTLAADARNRPGLKLYESTGFCELFRRLVYVLGPPRDSEKTR